MCILKMLPETRNRQEVRFRLPRRGGKKKREIRSSGKGDMHRVEESWEERETRGRHLPLVHEGRKRKSN